MENIISVPVPVSKRFKDDFAAKPASLTCKECGTRVDQKDKCLCRPHLCYKCCECGLDCDACNCSVKLK